jgi:TP901 family phage tail tape measure protein
MAEAHRMAAEQEAAALAAAAERVAEAQRAADARYAAASPRAQRRLDLRATSALARATPEAEVGAQFGSQALAAAQQTNLANAYRAVHDQVGQGAPKFKTLAVAMSDAHSAARGLASGFGAMYLTWGSLAPLLVGAAISQGFMASIRLGVEARQSFEVLKVLSQESEQSVAALEERMASLARTGPFGPTKVAEAMKILSLAGLNASEVAASIKPALDLAVAGGVTIEKSAETLSAVGTAYGYSAEQYSLVSDAITKAAAISMSSVDSMAESFRASTMIAQAYGVSLKDTATGLALLANVGIRGSSAGVALRQMYSELSGASRVTREAMKKLGVEVLDESGKMKDLLSITQALSEGLSKLSGRARVRAIQDISNERGGKGLIANLAALEAEVIRKSGDMGDKSGKKFKEAMTNKFMEIRDKMDEMAGFSANAAARLASTPQALLQGVGASFQQALVDAFKAVEPTLIVLSARLREVFNSPEFVGGITSMVKAVGSFTTVLFDNVGMLEVLGKAFLVYKAGQALLLTMELVSAAMATTAVRTGLAAMGFRGMATAAAAAAPAVGGLAAATGVLAATLKLAGPLAVVITLAALAWETYTRFNEDSKQTAIDADRQRTDVTIEALKAEADRLRDVNAEILKGEEARYAEAKAKEESAKQSRRLAFDEGRAPLLQAAQAAREKLAREQQLNNGRGRPAVVGTLQQENAAALAKLRAFDDGFDRDEQRMRYEAARVRGESIKLEALRQAQEDKKPKRGAGLPWDSAGGPPGMEAQQAARERDERARSEVQAMRGNYEEMQAAAKLAYDREIKLTEAWYAAKGLNAEQYADRTEAAAEALYASELARLDAYLEQVKAKLVAAAPGLAGTPALQAYIDEFTRTQRAVTAAQAKAAEDRSANLRLSAAKAAKKDFDLRMPEVPKSPAPLEGGVATWAKNLSDWKDTDALMRNSMNAFMDSWQERGRSMWGEFMRNGKVSLKSLKDLVWESLADLTYKRFIAEPMSRVGGALFDRALAPVGRAGTAGDTGFSTLQADAESLGASMTKLGNSMWELFMQAGRGLAEMMGGSEGGGFGAILAKLFTGGGQSSYLESDGMGGYTEVPTGSAKGNAFDLAGAYAFAKGGLPMNTVISDPHYFRFGRGGSSLGVAGEAGPEAIMPLARGADGNLGVRAQIAGGGGQQITVAPKTTVVIENHGGGPEPQVTQQSQPNGDEMIRVVLGAAAKDINRGGNLRKSVQSVQGRSNLPRY